MATACLHRPLPSARAPACDERGPGPSLPEQKRDSITETLDGNWPDADWARAARAMPGGFAGFYFEHPDSVSPDVPRVDGHPIRQRTIVRLVYPERRAEALRALRQWFPDRPRRAGLDFTDPLIVRARWDFAQLFDWYRYLMPPLHAMPGVYMSDIQEGENRIVVGAITPAVERQVLKRAAELGAPCGLVRTTYAGPAQLHEEPLRRPPR